MDGSHRVDRSPWLSRLLRRLADVEDPGSLANRFRRRRLRRFARLLDDLDAPVRVLDVGGTVGFWERSGLLDGGRLDVTVLNLEPGGSRDGRVRAVEGSALDLGDHADDSIDVVFSNSVIEHVGGLVEQHRMADEIRRVARRYWVQTPSRWSPIEPHFLFPYFGVLPMRTRAWILRHVALVFTEPVRDRQESLDLARSIRLLRLSELRALFPEAGLVRERVLGVTKSFVLVDGWDAPSSRRKGSGA